MSFLRNMLAWLLIVGVVPGAFWISEVWNESSANEREDGPCPIECRYKKHWGRALDPRLSFIGASTPPFCPIHSSRLPRSRG